MIKRYIKLESNDKNEDDYDNDILRSKILEEYVLMESGCI